MSAKTANPLAGVEALTFDVFGTVVDWLGTVSNELESHAKGKSHPQSENWDAFTTEWRKGYLHHTYAISHVIIIHD